MPHASPRPCRRPGCQALVVARDGLCDPDRAIYQRESEAKRGSAAARGYGRAWQKASKAYLRAHPLCQCPECDEGRKRVTPAVVVDHIIPHRGDMALFWDSDNWQSMAKTCHDRKTATEDGGWGRAGQNPGRASL